ncbi:MAG: hypothetical protein NVS3B21_19020 [Acidimicrobiales bacterium]
MSAVVEMAPAKSEWSRRYPPLVSVAVALLIAILVLPSALNIPQSNPTQTQEYAPVPPDDQKKPPMKGNNASFGLGNDATISDSGTGGGGPGGGGLPPAPPPGTQLGLPPGIAGAPLPGKSPTTKQCVRDPKGVLRQSDDPLSPPCVADFRGDNFGATYQGVTAQEVRLLVYLQGNITYVNTCSTPNEQAGSGVYYDLAVPPTGHEDCYITGLRTMQTYFNQRYQTYGRFVHMYAYYSPEARAPDVRRADAADNYSKIKPFAVISYGQTYEDDYLKAMAQYHVLNFGSFNGRNAKFFNEFPKLIWGYAPSVEQQAANYGSFVCQKMANKPTSFSDAQMNGKPRKYGLIYSTDAGHPELRQFKDLVKAKVTQCGVEFASTGTFPITGRAVSTQGPTDSYAQTNMAQFKSAGVTSIIWAGGVETKMSQAAQAINYYPEWVLAGDGGLADGAGTNGFQNAQEWSHAWVVTYEPYVPKLSEEVCYQAFKSVDPNATDSDTDAGGCGFYDQLRQVFTGIQVAGPRLGPTSVDAGYHAIPPQESLDPRVPACFYDTGDYSCIKDGAAQWWDPAGTPPGGSRPTGCWKASDHGRRYLTDKWPVGDVLNLKKPDDKCSGFGRTFYTQ